MRLWIRNPLGIVAENASGGVVVEGGVIAELVAAGATPAAPVDAVFDASEHVVLPGLINTHHHFYQTLTRAHPAAIDRELFPWLTALYPLWARLTPEDLRLAVRAALAELLLSGCTTAADHHYLYPPGLEDAVDIAVEEARALGIRATISRGSMNLSQKDGGLPPDTIVQDEDTILADSERVLTLFHDPSPGSMVQIALAPCSPFSVTPSLMAKSADLAARFDAPLHTHLAETKDEDAYCLQVYGKRPLDLLEETGWMRPKTWLAHGVHFSCEECDRLGRAGVGVCHCPTSNGVLASGFCRTRELEAAGAPLGLGVDGSASNDGSNLMEELRHALLINRLRYESAAAVTARDVIRWATQGSARCLGRSDIGMIAPGMQADLALYRLDELRFSGAHDPVAALVLCGAHRADRVMVAGRWRVIDGAIPGLDLAALRRAHGAASRRYA
ncbi:MAG TPA: 8-oxoguanine deaminase [Bosea sp. (in: a-proteobacteria)]|jgi:8-oxoguanine deaminase|uniref:8-oxoguanine deaminase n=1 Tax=Bosea sp. (in: a-proteobacteria) TaxID=1871050 RepID=UPI002DDCD269|nr:8-oxoguanine deaminase [Bosea sp. (in: a-proteobacteria)]HEV2552314.1 8-oxoguanine deaminase [Bosea sp. (in: a-proteobacteria)]